MRKSAILSIVATSILLIGCGQDKATQTESEPAKTETVTQKATKAVEAVKETASAVAQKTTEVAKEATKEVSEKASKAVEATKEVATKAIEKATTVAKEAVSGAKAPAEFAKCAGCHGKDGKLKALGKSEIIAGQSKDDLIKKIGEYKAGTRDVSGMGGLMKGQVAGLTDDNIKAIATYLSGIK